MPLSDINLLKTKLRVTNGVCSFELNLVKLREIQEKFDL